MPLFNPYSAVVEALTGNHLLLLPDAPKFTIVAASKDYLTVSNSSPTDIVGRGVFEIFPGVEYNGPAGLLASLHKVLDKKQPDQPGIIRYDLRTNNGTYEERYWETVNSPILNEAGETIYILQSIQDITDKIKAAQIEEVIKGLTQVNNLFAQVPVPVCILKGANLVVELANEPTLELWGKGHEVIGKPLMQVIPEVQGQGHVELISKVLQTGKPRQVYESPVTLIRKGKEQLLYLNYVYQPYYEEDKTTPAGVLVIGLDVTERILLKHELEEKSISLSESNKKLNSFLEVVPQIIWTNKPNGEIDFYNQQWFNYTGLNYQQSKEWGWQEVIHPDDLPSTMVTYIDKLQKGEEIVIENRFKRFDGEYRWQLNRAIPIKDNKGSIKFWLGTCTDIHDRKLAEDALKDSEYRYRTLIEKSTIATALHVGREIRVQYANDIMLSSWGKDKSIIGKPMSEGIPELKGQPFLGLLDKVYTTGVPYIGKEEKASLLVDGKLQDFYFNYSFQALRDASGEIYGIHHEAIDVTGEVLAKRALQESEERLRNIILQAPVAMCIFTGRDFVIDIANSSMFRFWGKSAEEVMHKPIFEAVPEAKNQGYEELLANVLNTGEGFAASELTVTLPRDGKVETVYINFAFEPIRDENGVVSGIMALAIDVTEQVLARKKIEEVVDQRTKELAEANESLTRTNHELISSNAGLEQFAYAASHDMQEPLRKIETFSSILEKENADHLSERAKSILSKIGNSASRMKTIIQDLLQYSNQRFDGIQENVNLNEVISQVESDLEITIQQNNVQIYLDPLPGLYAVKGQLNQLFFNLIGNSIKFAKKDTPPQIQISSKMLTPEEVEDRKTLNPDKQYLQIAFKDNGIGFDQQYADRIFQLFTRLHGKAEYEGTGIGLGLCKKIVQNHKGDIWAVSEEGKGSTFYVALPINADR